MWHWPDLKRAVLDGGILGYILSLPTGLQRTAIVTADTEHPEFIGQEWWLCKLSIGLQMTRIIIDRSCHDNGIITSAIHDVVVMDQGPRGTLACFFSNLAMMHMAYQVHNPPEDRKMSLPIKLEILRDVIHLLVDILMMVNNTTGENLAAATVHALQNLGIYRAWPMILQSYDSGTFNADRFNTFYKLAVVAAILTDNLTLKYPFPLPHNWAPSWVISFDVLLRFAMVASEGPFQQNDQIAGQWTIRPLRCIAQSASLMSSIIGNVLRTPLAGGEDRSSDPTPPKHVMKLWGVVCR